ncbi:lamin-B1-like [Sparus aurata]|uniref:lamin-B1-like n=1 Tax=Sparus aurata TaxID=8175 RepID=UPI0011C13347|nr:lamin-B1-like [Sparus aurata]
MMEGNLQPLIEELDSKNLELERARVSTVPPFSSSSSLKWQLVSRQKSQAEQQKREEAENKVRILEERLEKKTREVEKSRADAVMQLLQERQKRHKAQREVDTLKSQSQCKIHEVDSLRTNVKKLSEENLKLRTELANKKKQYEENTQTSNTTWKKTNDELKDTKAQLKSKKEEISQLRIQWEKKLHEEKTNREAAEKEVEKLNKDLKTKRDACKCEAAVHNTSSPSQRSPGPIIEVDLQGKYVRIKNASKEDQHLEGWMLHVQINSKRNIMYTFGKSFKISPGKTLTLWDPNHPPTDLIWQDLRSLSSGDNLQVTLYDNTKKPNQLNQCALKDDNQHSHQAISFF